MNKAKVLLMGIVAIGIVGGAIAAKAKHHFTTLRCSIDFNPFCGNLTQNYRIDALGYIKYCDKVTAAACTVKTKVNQD